MKRINLNKLKIVNFFISLILISNTGYIKSKWTTFGYNNRNTFYNPFEYILGPSNISNLELAWSINHKGTVNGGIAVYNNIAYYGTSSGNLYARNITNGDIIWQVNLEDAIEVTPLIVNNIIYVSTENYLYLYALNINDGSTIWRVIIDERFSNKNVVQAHASPVYADGMVFVGTSDTAFTELLTPTPTGRSSISAFNALTGQFIWRFDTTSGINVGAGQWGNAAIDENLGLIFIGTGQAIPAQNNQINNLEEPYNSSIVALNYKNGEVVWSFKISANSSFGFNNPLGGDTDVGSAPNLFIGENGQLLVGTYSKRGIFYAIDRRTGLEVWHTATIPQHFSTHHSYINGIYGDPSATVIDNIIYTAANYITDTSLSYEDINDITSLAFNNSDGTSPYFPYLTNLEALGSLTDNYTNTVIKALNASDGSVIWERIINGNTAASLSSANNIIYVYTNGTLTMLSALNGTILNTIKNIPSVSAQLLPICPVTISNGYVFIPTGSTTPGIAVYTVPQSLYPSEVIHSPLSITLLNKYA